MHDLFLHQQGLRRAKAGQGRGQTATSISGHTEAALPGDRPPSLFSRHARATLAPSKGRLIRQCCDAVMAGSDPHVWCLVIL
jgi:hypothetical protein